MEFSNASTRLRSIPAQEWVLPSANALWNATEGESGLNPNPDMERTSSSPSQVDNNQQKARPQIVIIEDNPTDVFLVQETLTASNIDAELLLLEDGEQAFELLGRLETDVQARCPDLILLDINLPRTDGFQVLAQLRKNNHCANVEVIVMTSSAAQDDRAQAMSLHAQAYFQKPNDYNDFLKLGELINLALGCPKSN